VTAVVAQPAAPVASRLREAILAGELSPGEQIRQADWAERLGVSRVPIREALKALAAEGLLNHDPNRGYFVVRFGPHQMVQIYRMRRLLETELLRSIEWPDVEQFARLERLGHAASARMQEGDFEAWNALEHHFDQELYALSSLDVIQAEVERLWLLSNVYRMVGFEYHQPERKSFAVGYYQRMLDALVARDRDALVRHLCELRERSEHSYTEKLGQRLPLQASD
jgi:DNA-binding GntR family transcriptional regulator